MNEHHVKGTAKDIAGKVQEKVGELTNDRSTQAKGLAKQVEGKLQKGVGDVKDAAQDAKAEAHREQGRQEEAKKHRPA